MAATSGIDFRAVTFAAHVDWLVVGALSMVAMKTKSALSWFGSDSEVAADLALMLNHCSHVTIPFVGGAAILPHLKARAILANDLHEDAINFYRVASGLYGEEEKAALALQCDRTLSHPAELVSAKAIREASIKPYGVGAWAFWAQCWIGRKGKGGTTSPGGMPSVRRTASGGTNASRITAAASDLAEWAQHFKRCEWLCEDFRKVLEKATDHEGGGIYCDPPWVGAGDGYLHAFTEQDHCDLALYLQRFHKTTVVVRYGDSPLVRDLYEGWTIIEAASRDQCNAVKGEIWITNR